MSAPWMEAEAPRAGPSEPPAPRDERTLVTRFVAGDAACARELFERYRRRVRTGLFVALGPDPLLDDLVQDVFLEVFRGIRGFRGESSLSTWVQRCAQRVAIRHVRRQSARRRGDRAVQTGSEVPSAEERAFAREALDRLSVILDRLGPKQSGAFVLHVIEGKSVGEVSRLTRSTLSATKARIRRTRRYLAHRAQVDRIIGKDA
ncbi:MAG: RNA polymerase sigma factor, partial [Myxococcales bacterium]|nr:RNA polymerase sigma factor [Myxococcales bacterium]